VEDSTLILIFDPFAILPWLGSLLASLRYVMYFRFCGWHHVFLLQWAM